MANVAINGPGNHNDELHLYDVVYEDELNDEDEEDDLFDLF